MEELFYFIIIFFQISMDEIIAIEFVIIIPRDSVRVLISFIELLR